MKHLKCASSLVLALALAASASGQPHRPPDAQEALKGQTAKARQAVAEAETRLGAAKTDSERCDAQVAIGRAWLSIGDHARGRQEFEKALKFAAANQSHLRSAIQTYIADSYMAEQNYPEAVKAYTRAQEIGPGGWRVGHVAKNLKLAQERAGFDAAEAATGAAEAKSVEKPAPIARGQVSGPAAQPQRPSAVVNVASYADLVAEGDWSPAIQAAIDSVNAENGYVRGAEILFPPGDYRIDQTLVLGKNPEHWGVRLIGYGARLIGSPALDSIPQEPIFQARVEAIKKVEKGQAAYLRAIEYEKNLGPAILELINPPGYEGAGFVIEGLTFDRQARRKGIGIKVPAETVPKATSFRSIRVFNQDIGVYINYAWQFYFSDCVIRANRIGVLGQNHFNSVSFVNCVMRRNQQHGLQIGPNAGQWGSSAVHISGSIFEANDINGANGGYGILNAGGVQVNITGCYFEANGGSIRVASPFGSTTVDTCHFWGAKTAHVSIGGTRNVQIRNNRYGGKGQNILLDGSLAGVRNRFDADPAVAEGVRVKDGFRAASDDGLSYYEYDGAAGRFVRKSLGGTLVQDQDNPEQDG